MARTRNIKPGLFKNEELADCSMTARYLYAGLWTLADRDGYLEDRPRRIKAELFPYDDVDVEALLMQLFQKNFIIRYSVDGVGCIWVPTFLEHQSPHPNEKSFGLPVYDSDTSKLLVTDKSLLSNSTDERRIKGLEARRKEGTAYTPDFEMWWKSYPKKVGKRGAFAQWKSLKAGKALPEVDRLVKATEIYKKSDTVQRGFILDPERWLKRGRWEDEPTKNNGQKKTKLVPCPDCGGTGWEQNKDSEGNLVECAKCKSGWVTA